MATFTVYFSSKSIYNCLKDNSFDVHQNGDEFLVNFEFYKYEDLTSIISDISYSIKSLWKEDFDNNESFIDAFFSNMWDNSEDLGIQNSDGSFSDEMIKWENDLKDFYYGH
jgi:hypothetical protein